MEQIFVFQSKMHFALSNDGINSCIEKEQLGSNGWIPKRDEFFHRSLKFIALFSSIHNFKANISIETFLSLYQ